MYANTRGSVMIHSDDPFVKPQIRFNYLSTSNDRREWIQAVKTARTVLSQPAFEGIDGGELSPGLDVKTDEEILDWVRRDAETALHPCGTARMGVGAEAVVDPKTMGVHSIKGLKVVDASVMPFITNGNIYAPTMMIAEKAADLILGNTPLEPEEPGFYQ
jgi:choline dehydrogenase